MKAASYQEEATRIREQARAGNPTDFINLMEEAMERYSNYKEHEKEEEFAKFVKLYNEGDTNMMFTITWATMIFGPEKAAEVFQNSFPYDTREEFFKSRFAKNINKDPKFTSHIETVLIGDRKSHMAARYA